MGIVQLTKNLELNYSLFYFSLLPEQGLLFLFLFLFLAFLFLPSHHLPRMLTWLIGYLSLTESKCLGPFTRYLLALLYTWRPTGGALLTMWQSSELRSFLPRDNPSHNSIKRNHATGVVSWRGSNLWSD